MELTEKEKTEIDELSFKICRKEVNNPSIKTYWFFDEGACNGGSNARVD